MPEIPQHPWEWECCSQQIDFTCRDYRLLGLSYKGSEADLFMHENIQVYGFKSSMKLWLKKDSWGRIMAVNTFWHPVWKESSLCFAHRGSLIAFSESVLVFMELRCLSSWEELHLLCVFGQILLWRVVLSCLLQAWGWWLGKTSLSLPNPEEPAGRGLCTEELDFSLGVTEEFKDSCVRKHPYFKYSSLQTRDRSGFIYGLIIFLPVLQPSVHKAEGNTSSLCTPWPRAGSRIITATPVSGRSATHQQGGSSNQCEADTVRW